ncbi:MAG: hypothetical protein GX076_08745 [Clostridiales bacterium]|nr:hypothetical protein [Clostridiales bacterium]
MRFKCGVRFCGGCNPRYDRGKALEKIKEHFKDRIEFSYAKEDVDYDILLVIGGCTNNCASFSQFNSRLGHITMWSENHIDRIIEELEATLLKES